MIKEFDYKPNGVCSRFMHFKYDDDSMVLLEFSVVGGCDGNLKGIKSLIEGMEIPLIIKKLSNIKCGFKPTSCPDQISKALSLLIKVD